MVKPIIYGVLLSLYYFFGIHAAFTVFAGLGIFFKLETLNIVLLTLVNMFALYEVVLHLKKHPYFKKHLRKIFLTDYFMIIILTNLLFMLMHINMYTVVYEFIITTLGFIYIRFRVTT